jgi:hypothetical protein
MAAGVPVVASPVAIEGMNLDPGKHLLVALSPADYQTHIGRILDDPEFARGLANAAKAHIYDVYGPNARSEGIRALAGNQMAGSGSTPSP